MPNVPKTELTERLARFTAAMNGAHPDWELCALVGSMNLYYLTGTICDGALIIKRGQTATLWVKRSFDRAIAESPLADVRPLNSFRDVAADIGTAPDALYLDTQFATLEWYAMLSKYVKFKDIISLDKTIMSVRAVKSAFELDIMRRSGTQIERLLLEKVPEHLREGVSEADLCAELYAMFVKNGHHGLSRFSMRNADTVLGHICFGTNALSPSVFNGASGITGLSAGAPVLGSRTRLLTPGDLIYVDIGYGEDGYNVDKTFIYTYKSPQSAEVTAAHTHCLELERLAASLLVPGAKPSDVYAAVMDAVKPEYRSVFMGAEGRTVKFIGHSIGLFIDETPVIARGFDEPLRADMTIALEPKIGLSGIGMVGSENTYWITDSGAVGLTGAPRDIIVVP